MVDISVRFKSIDLGLKGHERGLVSTTRRLNESVDSFVPMRKSVVLIFYFLVHVALAQPVPRVFNYGYEAVFEALEPGTKVRMWAPLPQNNSVQKVGRLRMSPPLKARLSRDDHGNRLLFMEGDVPQSGILKLRVEGRVERFEWNSAQSEPLDNDRYLKPSKLVPVDDRVLSVVGGRPLEGEPEVVARKLYDAVLEHLAYDKSQPGYGRGDSIWACDSRTGNCTDFHSLFLSLARLDGIPARFEIGYSLPADKTEGELSGYHCWASFWNGQGWIPVDISEADKHPKKANYFFGHLDVDRVTLSVGRDLIFQPEQEFGPVNYFVRPVLEIEGEMVEAQRLKVFFRPER